MAIKPIFLFSVSRSGSTLVQRIIAAHEGVATVSEPWVLLPIVYQLRSEGVLAEYVHPLLVDAVSDFSAELPQGSDEYWRQARDYVLRLYSKAAGPDARYFLDKSPPYCLVASEIMGVFPAGKFLFLWRNPLSIIASVIETWQHGRWHPTMFRSDLFLGLPRLVAAYEAAPDRCYSARFEDLVLGEPAHWAPLMSHLGLDFDPGSVTRFSGVELNGRMGDPTGVKRYRSLNSETTGKWKGTFGNPLRREWARRYLRFLGRHRLEVMGYSLERLLEDLEAERGGSHSLLRDTASVAVDAAKEPFQWHLRRAGLGGPERAG